MTMYCRDSQSILLDGALDIFIHFRGIFPDVLLSIVNFKKAYDFRQS